MKGSEALEAAWSASDDEGPRDPSAHTFAAELVEGVKRAPGRASTRSSSSTATTGGSIAWPRIDRNILRLGVFELKYRVDIPKNVTINEAVELGKKFGNEESAAFINGLLDRVALAVGKS